MQNPFELRAIHWGIAFFLTLSACSPATLEDLRCQGEAETKKLAMELKGIETKEELERAVPKLKKRFNRIADLLIEIRKHPNLQSNEPTEASEELFIELSRLYEIPGGRELIEIAQTEAVRVLSK